MQESISKHDQHLKELLWIGKLPIKWKTIELRYVLSKSIDFRGRTPQKVESGIQLITARNIKDGKIDYNISKEYVTEDEYRHLIKRGEVKKGDVLFTSEAPLGQVALIDNEEIALAQRIILFRGSSIIDNVFLKLYLESTIGQAILLSRSSGSTASGIRSDKLFDIPTIVPPLETQKQIANFLDKETSRIDTLISKKQRQIELLQEKRQAIITQTVTKGLNPDVKMKDSGVEWIGEIPEHWEVKRLRHIGDAIIGLTYSPDEITNEENGTLVLRASNIQNGQIELYDNVYVTKDIPLKLRTKEDDILICSRNGSQNLVGKSAMITKDKKGLSFGAFTTIFRSKINKYLIYFFNSGLMKEQAGLFQTSTIFQLTTGILNNFKIAVPPDVYEQNLIIKYLDQEISKMELLVEKIKKSIELLKEYRSSLITHAVSGQIDISKYEVEYE